MSAISMKRLIIFAHYDRENVIDPYVISYLRELKKYSDSIIFVSDSDLGSAELEKISGLLLDSIAGRHGEYDFGSYKRGFQLAKDKYFDKFQEVDEVIFVNDSCYLVGSFAKVFFDMEKRTEYDCWSLTDDTKSFFNPDYNLQSFFLVFRKSVFLEDFFSDFVNDVSKLFSKEQIIEKYEVGLSKLLLKNKKRIFAYYGDLEIDEYMVRNKRELYAIFSKLVRIELLFSKLFRIHRVTGYIYLPYKMPLMLCAGLPVIKVGVYSVNRLNVLPSLFRRFINNHVDSGIIKEIDAHVKRNIFKNSFILAKLNRLKSKYIFCISQYGFRGKLIRVPFIEIKYDDRAFRIKIFAIRCIKFVKK